MTTIPPISTDTTAAGTTSTRSSAAANQALLDRDAFLKLLVAQLKYQDPTKPIDATEMISQSAQLSVVDKLGEISTLLDRATATDRLSLAGSVIGKQVAFPDTDGKTVTAVVSHVQFVDGQVVLAAGGWDVPYDAVLAVADAPTPTPTD